MMFRATQGTLEFLALSTLGMILVIGHSIAAAQVEQPGNKSETLQIAGRCVNQTGEPLSDALVRVVRYDSEGANTFDSPELVTQLHTNADGLFGPIPVAATTNEYGQTDVAVIATRSGHASRVVLVDSRVEAADLKMELDNDPGTLVGFIRSPSGKPVVGALVYLPARFAPIVGVRAARTDASGKYRIDDVSKMQPSDTRFSLIVAHADYANTRVEFNSVPAVLNVQLVAPAVVEGRVIDRITGTPVPNALVSAQGVAQSGWHQTRSDASGNYRLLMDEDRYNIWATLEDRIPIAVDSLAAVPGQTATGADIAMVQGAIVYGHYIDASTGKPVEDSGDVRVAHYGPARPRSGAAVTSTPVAQDGSFRIRVAPGKNYLYVMGASSSAWVEVEDGQELKLDLVSGRTAPIERGPVVADAVAPNPQFKPSRERGVTPAARLLDRLEEQNGNQDRFQEPWLKTLKQIVELGPAAVPDLCQELDATQDNMMMRCMGFALRAIGDPLAMPALIRAIPKTLFPPGSDMGLRAEDKELREFAYKFDLQEKDEAAFYSFGRPVREIFGAIHKLTGHKLNDEQLFSIFLTGTEAQRRMKQAMFNQQAIAWEQWWEETAEERAIPLAFREVGLPELEIDAPAIPLVPGARYKADGSSSGWILESIHSKSAKRVAFDFDTGRVSPLPQVWQGLPDAQMPMKEVEQWATEQGFDMLGVQVPTGGGETCYAIKVLGMQVWELDNSRWKSNPSSVTLEELIAEGREVKDYLFHEENKIIDPLGTASFLVITREGTPGLIYVGVEVQDDSLKPGGMASGDDELKPVAFYKGRRFAFCYLQP